MFPAIIKTFYFSLKKTRKKEEVVLKMNRQSNTFSHMKVKIILEKDHFLIMILVVAT